MKQLQMSSQRVKFVTRDQWTKFSELLNLVTTQLNLKLISCVGRLLVNSLI